MRPELELFPFQAIREEIDEYLPENQKRNVAIDDKSANFRSKVFSVQVDFKGDIVMFFRHFDTLIHPKFPREKKSANGIYVLN